MTPEEPWEELIRADEAYFSSRMRLFASDPQAQLRTALTKPRAKGPALRVLRDAPIEIVMDLVEHVFAVAASTHPQAGLAREVLARLDGGWLHRELRPLVEERLTSGAASWEDYLRIAESLSALDQKALLERLVQLAESADDADTREVADDYRARWSDSQPPRLGPPK